MDAEPSILTAEALLATTGILPDPLQPADGALARGLPDEFRAEVAAFLDAKAPRAFRAPKPVDPAKLLDTLIRGLDASQRSELVAGLQDPGLGDAYLTVLESARQLVRTEIPQLEQQTPLGPKPLPLGEVERGRIAATVAVVNDPSRILEEMRMGTLTAAQASAFGAAYPQLFEMLKAMVWEELVKRFKTPEGYDLPWPKERVLRTLVGLPPELSITKVEQPRPEAAHPDIKVDFKGRLETKAQRLEAGAA